MEQDIWFARALQTGVKPILDLTGTRDDHDSVARCNDALEVLLATLFDRLLDLLPLLGLVAAPIKCASIQLCARSVDKLAIIAHETLRRTLRHDGPSARGQLQSPAGIIQQRSVAVLRRSCEIRHSIG